MSVEQNKIITRTLFEEVFNDKKVELIGELVAEDVVDHNKIIFAQPQRPASVAEGIRMLLVAFPDLSVAVERLVGEEDYVVVQVRMAGTNTGPYPRVPTPTGRHTEWESMVVPDEGRQDSRIVGHVRPDGHAYLAGDPPGHKLGGVAPYYLVDRSD